MRGNFFSRGTVLFVFALFILNSTTLLANELFVVGRQTAEYFDGNTWTQMYDAKPFELNRLRGVWGTSDLDIYAVGSNGTIAHYDGVEWNDMSSGTSVQLERIWGSSSSDMFAVGAEGTILHYDGNSWSAMSSGTSYDLYDIYGVSSTDIYVVGDEIVLHYNGHDWYRFTTGYTGVFQAVWANSNREVFVSSVGRIIYYDGNNWRELNNNPVSSGIHDIWANSADDVFFACDSGIILHYDGKQFTITFAGSGNLRGISGINVNDLYAASYSGSVYHYNGNEWNEYDISSLIYLNDILAISTNNIITVGSEIWTLPRAVIYESDGVDWTSMLPNRFPDLDHVWAGSSDNIFVVGERDGIKNIVFHYDGFEWTETQPVPPLDPICDLWGTTSDNLYAITGGDENILHYDGVGWSIMLESTSGYFRDIWGNSASDMYVLSGGGKIFHYAGSEWSELTVTPYKGMSSIYGSPSGEILVVGYNWPWNDICRGLASYYDGSGWSTMELYQGSINGQDFTSIWGYSASDIFFTIGNLMYHFDGEGLVSIETPIEFGAAYDAYGYPEGNLYFVNGTEQIHHYDGNGWSILYSGNELNFTGICGWGDFATHALKTPVAHFTLDQNYPNPFNPTTAIEYSLEKEGNVIVEIYSVSGQLICTLLDAFQTPGKHTIRWEGLDNKGKPIASGIYLCRIKTSFGTQTRKMVLAR